MQDHAALYGTLCLAVLSALDALPDTPENAGGRAILETALLSADQVLKGDNKNKKEAVD